MFWFLIAKVFNLVYIFIIFNVFLVVCFCFVLWDPYGVSIKYTIHRDWVVTVNESNVYRLTIYFIFFSFFFKYPQILLNKRRKIRGLSAFFWLSNCYCYSLQDAVKTAGAEVSGDGIIETFHNDDEALDAVENGVVVRILSLCLWFGVFLHSLCLTNNYFLNWYAWSRQGKYGNSLWLILLALNSFLLWWFTLALTLKEEQCTIVFEIVVQT